MDEELSDAEVDAVLDVCSQSDFVEAMRLLLADWTRKMHGKTQPCGASMDKATFDEVVNFARFCMKHSPMGKRTPGGALLAAYEHEDSSIIGGFTGMAVTERWAWDAALAVAEAWLREEARLPHDEILPGYVRGPLAAWTADVLIGKKKPPPRGATRLANRDICVAEAVYVLTLVFDLNPTRNIAKRDDSLPKSCAKGGSACDVVGKAQGLNYKTAEKAWTRYGELVSERLGGKDAAEILMGWGSESRLFYSKPENK